MPAHSSGADERAEGMGERLSLVAKTKFGAAAINMLGALVTPDLPHENSMPLAVACQLMYLEHQLVARGLLPAAMEVRIYRKGPDCEGEKAQLEWQQSPCDIVALQDNEIDRLNGLVLEGREYQTHLLEDLGEELENVEKLKELRDTASAEARMLDKRGP